MEQQARKPNVADTEKLRGKKLRDEIRSLRVDMRIQIVQGLHRTWQDFDFDLE